MNAIQQKVDRLVTVECPNGHVMWSSIKLTTLWKNHSLRFGQSQCIYEGMDYTKARNFMIKHGVEKDKVTSVQFDSQNKDKVKLPIYRMSSQQVGWCKKKCEECETSLKEKSVLVEQKEEKIIN